uniref:Uncharacterized protein n=1 Tax=Solanum tuberosum TaxID=4113 RepID=M0ZUL9_SOLTU
MERKTAETEKKLTAKAENHRIPASPSLPSIQSDSDSAESLSKDHTLSPSSLGPIFQQGEHNFKAKLVEFCRDLNLMAEMEKMQSQQNEDDNQSFDAFTAVMGHEHPGCLRLYG